MTPLYQDEAKTRMLKGKKDPSPESGKGVSLVVGNMVGVGHASVELGKKILER